RPPHAHEAPPHSRLRRHPPPKHRSCNQPSDRTRRQSNYRPPATRPARRPSYPPHWGRSGSADTLAHENPDDICGLVGRDPLERTWEGSACVGHPAFDARFVEGRGHPLLQFVNRHSSKVNKWESGTNFPPLTVNH